jgi:ATP-dependent DNA helicase RecG
LGNPAESKMHKKISKKRKVKLLIEKAYESQFIETASIQDLDLELLYKFQEKLGSQEDPITILQNKYRLIESSNGKDKICMACLLLFAKNIIRWHPRCGVDFVKYRGTRRLYGEEFNVIERIRLEEPILKLILKSIKLIKARTEPKTITHNLFFKEFLTYPTGAIKEAIINAIAHRDYTAEGMACEVWEFTNRIEVRSPGLLPPSLTIRNIKRGRHYSRNPIIVRLLTDMGYMRELGSGISAMFDEAKKYDFIAPEIKEEETTFCVTIWKKPVFSEGIDKWLTNLSKKDISIRQKRILAYAYTHGGNFTSKIYQNLVGINRDKAYKDIRNLLEIGLIERQGGKFSRVYRVIA